MANMEIENFKKSQFFYKKIKTNSHWNISRPICFSARNVSETSKSKFITTYSGRTSYRVLRYSCQGPLKIADTARKTFLKKFPTLLTFKKVKNKKS